MRGPARRLLLAPVIGLLTLAGAGLSAADPVEMPEIVTAVATCDKADSSVQVWIDEELPVRLDKLRPGTGTWKQNVVEDEQTPGMYLAEFKGVTAGDYNVHIDGRDGVQDDMLVVVKPCGELKPADDILQVQVECKAGWGIVTIQVANPDSKEVVRYTLAAYNNAVIEDIDLAKGESQRVTLNSWDDSQDGADYFAKLTRSDGTEIIKRFTVKCESGNAPELATKVACTGTTGGVDVTVLNPNREAVGYTVALKGQTKSVKVGAGEKGTVNFAGIPAGEHPVKVTAGDTEANTIAKVNCGSTTTTTTPTSQPTTTTTPAPQGRSDSGLANTGASVGGLLAVGGLVIISGVALLFLVRRRRA
jgi:LPXTG-motif cell wall-anchored protein